MNTGQYYPSVFPACDKGNVNKRFSELNPRAAPFVSQQSKPLQITNSKNFMTAAYNNSQEFSPTNYPFNPIMKIKFNPFEPESFTDFLMETDHPLLSSPSFSDSRSTSNSFPFEKKTSHKPKLHPICTFALKGICRHGDFCRYAHGTLCPTCKTHVLHPDESPEEHQYHIHSCQVASIIDSEDNIECGICSEKVKSTKSGCFGLLSCEHSFCLDCIQSFRPATGFGNGFQKNCPTCMDFSPYIIPSYQWITDKREKDNLAQFTPIPRPVPCKYFNFGIGHCPFGNACFYDHSYLDGTRQEGTATKMSSS